MNYDTAFFEVFEEEEHLLRKSLPENHRFLFTRKTIQNSEYPDLPAPVISIRTQSQIPASWEGRLSAVFTRSTGYDHLKPYLQQSSTVLAAGHLPKYAARAVAEHNFLTLLMLIRKIDRQRKSMRTFSRDGLTGAELKGKTITVIGVGNIGAEVAKIAAGFEMKLLGVDLIERPEISRRYGLSYVDLSTGISESRIVVCCLPLTELTNRLLNYDRLCHAGKNAILINAARGEITPPEDLLRLLNEDILSGLSLDVYDEEPLLGSILRGNIALDDVEGEGQRNSLEATVRLIEHPRVITTPHNAFNTAESTERKAVQTAENINHFLETGSFLTPVPKEGI